MHAFYTDYLFQMTQKTRHTGRSTPSSMTVIHSVMTNNEAINSVKTHNCIIMPFPHFDTLLVTQRPFSPRVSPPVLSHFSHALVWKALAETAAEHPKAPENPISTTELRLTNDTGADKSPTLEPWVRCRKRSINITDLPRPPNQPPG